MSRRLRFVLLFVYCAASVISAEDDFYLQRLAEGRSFFEVKDYAQAAVNFRTAGFGLMKSPPRYEEALVWLALSDEKAGRTDTQRETLLRVLYVESRFPGSYDSAPLAAEQRQAFENLLLAALPVETLRPAIRFARLIKTDEQKLEELAPAARHGAYEKKASEDPAEGKWDLFNARLYLQEGQAKQAEKFARRALAAGAKGDEAAILRASALARLSRCADAVAAFESVAREGWEKDPELRADYGVCLAKVGRKGEAAPILAALPQEISSRPAVAKAISESRPEPRTEPRAEAAKSSTEAAKPTVEAAKPGTEAARPRTETAKPTTEAAKPTTEAAKPTEVARAPETRPSSAKGGYDAKAVAALLAKSNERLEARDLAGAEAALGEALKLAPGERSVLLRVGEVRYARGAWKSGAAVLGDLDPFRDDEAVFQFYFAVCLYNSAREAEARVALRKVLPRLSPSAVVENYRRLILGREGGG